MRARRICSRFAAVLAIAAIGFLVRSALQPDPAGPPGLAVAARPVAGAQAFSPRAAASRAVPEGASVIATAKHRRIYVRSRPDGGGRRRILHQRVFHGQRIPLTFLVKSQRKGWARVLLPSRPNLSAGWVRRRDVVLSLTQMRVVVRRRHHQLVVSNFGRVVMRTKVAVGKAVSPTPRGRYFVTDIVKPHDPHGFFGTYSLGTSAHSNVYTSFEGGDGQVGIHGTNEPSVIGTDVSHGCIRVSNRTVSRLARMLPLGTPVDIES